MVTTLLHVPIVILLLLTTSVLSLVMPHTDSRSSGSSSSSPSSNDLTKLHPLKAPSSLVCHGNNQRMSCYGGIPVTLQTCQDICTCENGRISCPTYKYCDDSTMDTFCGGMCGCRSSTTPSKLRADNDDDQSGEMMLRVPHRHRPESSRRRYDEDDEAEDDDDDYDYYDDAMVK